MVTRRQWFIWLVSCPQNWFIFAGISPPLSTSIFCTDRCHFHNLWYFPVLNRFAVIHGPDSDFYGINNRLNQIDAGGLIDHQAMKFDWIDLLPNQIEGKIDNFTFIEETWIFDKRFLPENLMHVIHDDLMPLFFTLKELRFQGYNLSDSGVLFVDNYTQAGPYWSLYEKVLDSRKVKFLHNLKAEDRPICFGHVIVGLSTASLWYQYGFHSFQGPIPNARVHGDMVREFAAIFNNRSDAVPRPAVPRQIVILSRAHNRLILNEAQLAQELSRKLNARTVIIRIEDLQHNLAKIFAQISASTALVGMHGSGLILAVFLPPGAALVELFPYGLNPAHFTPYRTLTALNGMRLGYASWRNTDLKASTVHPNLAPEWGGISYLPIEEQNRILASPEVARQPCCGNAEFLLRMYQDTKVDPSAIAALLKIALRNAEIAMGVPKALDFFALSPTEVDCLNCTVRFWTEPANLTGLKNIIASRLEIFYELQISDYLHKTCSIILLKVDGRDFVTYFWTKAFHDVIQIRAIVNMEAYVLYGQFGSCFC